MKKLFVLIVVFIGLTTVNTYGQGVPGEVTEAGKLTQVLPVGNVSKTAASIMGVLKSKLSLNESQSPKILESVKDFLKGKTGIVSLAKTDPAGYVSKFGEIKDRLLSTFKTELTATQFAGFMNLKPKTSSSGNVLSHLFY